MTTNMSNVDNLVSLCGPSLVLKEITITDPPRGGSPYSDFIDFLMLLRVQSHDFSHQILLLTQMAAGSFQLSQQLWAARSET